MPLEIEIQGGRGAAPDAGSRRGRENSPPEAQIYYLARKRKGNGRKKFLHSKHEENFHAGAVHVRDGIRAARLGKSKVLRGGRDYARFIQEMENGE
jgi:hypothetical protein